jgi:1,4-alpha-glucan branching enzyme
MPVSDFPGRRNRGTTAFCRMPDYLWQAEDFKALVDAAHARGLMVLLDVVYNHFGPEAPICTPSHQKPSRSATRPSGAAINMMENMLER